MMRFGVMMMCVCLIAGSAFGQGQTGNDQDDRGKTSDEILTEILERDRTHSNEAMAEILEQLRSCNNDNYESVIEFIKAKFDDGLMRNHRDPNGMTLLMHACRLPATHEIAWWLITKKRVDRDLRDRNGMLAMHHAAYNLDPNVGARVFGHFLYWRDDPNLRDGSGRDIVMHTIIANQSRRMVFLAIDATDEDLNRLDDSGHSAVSYAAMNNHNFRVWELLVEHGADLSKAYTKDLHTPLHLAARDNMAEVAGAIIREGAEIDARDVHGNTPMMLALLQNKDPLMPKYLLQGGADAKTRNDLGASVFHAASFGGQNASVFQQLVDAGAPTDEPTDSMLPTPAMLYAQYGQDPGVWAIFADQGMSLRYKCEQGSTLIMSALTYKKDIAFIWAMLDAGCDVNAAYTPFNTTALMMACKDGSAELVELMLDHGADATIVDVTGKTALDAALKNPRLEGRGVVERVRVLVED